jgi:hypothetical protein
MNSAGETRPDVGGEDHGHRHRRMDSITKHWLPFLTGLLGLVAAIIGVYAKQTSAELDSVNTKNEALEQTVDSLQEENNSTTTTRGVTTTTRGTTTTTAPPIAPEVFRESGPSPVVIQWGRGFDLDSQAVNWGIDSGVPDIVAKLDNFERHITGGPGNATFSVVDAIPTIDQCMAMTVTTSYTATAETVAGQLFCVRTNEDRWGYVRIAQISTDDRTVSFDVLVWKLPTDP